MKVFFQWIQVSFCMPDGKMQFTMYCLNGKLIFHNKKQCCFEGCLIYLMSLPPFGHKEKVLSHTFIIGRIWQFRAVRKLNRPVIMVFIFSEAKLDFNSNLYSSKVDCYTTSVMVIFLNSIMYQYISSICFMWLWL